MESAIMELPVALASLDPIRRALLDACADAGNLKLPVLVCDELLANIVEYSGATRLLFSCRRAGDTLTVVFKDNGARFDPFSSDAGAEKDFDALDEGGMGLGFVRQIASNCDWHYADGFNIVELTFRLREDAHGST